ANGPRLTKAFRFSPGSTNHKTWLGLRDVPKECIVPLGRKYERIRGRLGRDLAANLMNCHKPIVVAPSTEAAGHRWIRFGPYVAEPPLPNVSAHPRRTRQGVLDGDRFPGP